MNWVESIRTYAPCNEQEKKDQEMILHCIEIFDDVLIRDKKKVYEKLIRKAKI